MRATVVLSKVAMIAALIAAAAHAETEGAAAPVRAASPASPAGAYCVATGGVVQSREAVYGTNNSVQDWLPLAAVEDFCQYIASGDQSNINISLLTLYTTKPTLAALAYYAQVPWNGVGNGNPASFYCSQLGGAEIGATSGGGGAWVSSTGETRELETCIFPDNSTIDSWGLLYHSESIIRGIDLSTVMKYPNPYPAASVRR
jgi:putative hemolysin